MKYLNLYIYLVNRASGAQGPHLSLEAAGEDGVGASVKAETAAPRVPCRTGEMHLTKDGAWGRRACSPARALAPAAKARVAACTLHSGMAALCMAPKCFDILED